MNHYYIPKYREQTSDKFNTSFHAFPPINWDISLTIIKQLSCSVDDIKISVIKLKLQSMMDRSIQAS